MISTLQRLPRAAVAWLEALGVYSSDDPVAAQIRAAHLAGVVRQTPLMVLANLLNGVVACLAFAGTVHVLALVAWASALVALGLLGMRAVRRPMPLAVSPRAIRRAATQAVVLAMVWAVLPAVFFPSATPTQQMVVAPLVTGMLCGGAFALFPVPAAALGFVGVLVAASVYALSTLDSAAGWLLAALLVVYAVVLAAAVLWGAQLATARLLAEREASHQRQLVTMLLRDFEESAADVMWEIDEALRFTRASPRLCALVARSADELAASTLIEVLAALRPASDPTAGHAALTHALAERRSFRGIEVPVELLGVRRWWSLRAKYLDDGQQRGWRGVFTDVTDERDAHDRLTYLAHYDALTGLANRGRLREALQAALARADAHSTRAAVLSIDIDDFRSLNETLGNVAGDAVLRAVAQRIAGCVGPADVAARLGGDEFAVLLPELDADDDARLVAQRVVDAFREAIEVPGVKVMVSVSVGVAYLIEHGTTLDELLASVDLAVEAAKDSGRRRLAVFAPELGEKNRRRQAIEHALRTAVEKGGFELHLQLKVDTTSWRVTGAEALLRWRHPTLGPISPAEFIPIAEAAGLIDPIGEWVLREACRQTAERLPGLSIAVNVSAAQFVRSDFLASVESALIDAGLEAGRLEVEVTESMFMGEVPLALANLRGLRALGVCVALDDFGTGFSSLSYLRRFPFDTLKIDRAFVREMLLTKDARAIVSMIIQLANTLGMKTVAEGVEEEAQLDVLAMAGCHVIQGFLFAKPMPVGELLEFIERFHAAPRAHRARPSSLAPAGTRGPTSAAPRSHA